MVQVTPYHIFNMTTTATFVFADEDHTLGNALRYCLS